MIAEKMQEYIRNGSAIRAMFEEGKRMAAIYGPENVFDFSLGNPNVPAPQEVERAVKAILEEEDSTFIHGYMSNSGYEDVRKTIADSLNRRFDTRFGANNIIMTVGAAGGLNVVFKTLLNPGDEVIVFAPYFGEYRSYVANYDGVLVVVPPDLDTFQPNLQELEKKITENTKAVIVNSPNNPTGVVYSEETIKKLADILTRKQEEFNRELYLISDEPYRELVYDGAEAPYLTQYYKNTIVGYSFSKSLSLPGERIGYLVIPDEVADFQMVLDGLNVATRILGFVNAPSLFQLAAARCIDAKCNVAAYNRNRELLYNSLVSYGYECIKPEGAFYLFVKSPTEDERVFCEAAKKHNILVVGGSSFDCPGYVRIAYCVGYDTIVKALPGFLALWKEFADADGGKE